MLLLFGHWITWGRGVFVPENDIRLKEMYTCRSACEPTAQEILAGTFKSIK